MEPGAALRVPVTPPGGCGRSEWQLGMCPRPAALLTASRAPAEVTGARTGGIWAVTATGELPGAPWAGWLRGETPVLVSPGLS